jgi:hypothetical protein
MRGGRSSSRFDGPSIIGLVLSVTSRLPPDPFGPIFAWRRRPTTVDAIGAPLDNRNVNCGARLFEVGSELR